VDLPLLPAPRLARQGGGIPEKSKDRAYYARGEEAKAALAELRSQAEAA